MNKKISSIVFFLGVLILVSVISFFLGKSFSSPEPRVVKQPVNRKPPINMSSAKQFDVHPEVWAGNSPSGKTYEFKTNCFGKYSELYECFLFGVTEVLVQAPDGKIYLE